jgi:hypothetical protein
MLAVASGGQHTCSIANGGAVWCWGSSGFGQLGNGQVAFNADRPGAAGGLSGVTVIAAANAETSAIASGQIYYWGIGERGMGGNGEGPPVATPTAVQGTSDAFAITMGYRFACALFKSAPVIRCWGLDDGDQLGRVSCTMCEGATPCCPTPTGVPFPEAITPVAITAGDAHVCVAADTGKLYCWGDPANGKTGITASTTAIHAIASLDDVTALAAGTDFTCALRRSGAVVCFGVNDEGQLGRGSIADADATFADPAPVVGLPGGITAITAGGSHACALAPNGGVYCWGSNTHGELGQGKDGPTGTPAPVVHGPFL